MTKCTGKKILFLSPLASVHFNSYNYSTRRKVQLLIIIKKNNNINTELLVDGQSPLKLGNLDNLKI